MHRTAALLALAAGCLALLCVHAPAAPAPAPDKPALQDAPPPYEPTSAYEERRIEGWRVMVLGAFLRGEPELAAETLKVLGSQLHQVCRVAPAPALEKLKRVTIWVELAEGNHPCMAYHPDAGWLRNHGMNPDKARCVEIANAKNFLAWTLDQPWMVLHELAHAYHHQFLPGGYGNPEIAAAYKEAMEAKRYESVLHCRGADRRAYAATNPMEYFAENSEAYFGVNDFYPFVRAELKRHDPAAYALLEKLWGVK